jgi:hypothetical protein
VARALVPVADDCPEIVVSGQDGASRIPMSPRLPGPNAAPAFSEVLACSAWLPVGLISASINGHIIPASMPSSVNRIGLFADSGCRLDEDQIQACNDINK